MAITAHDPADSLLRALGARLGEQGLVHLERLPARPSVAGDLSRPLPGWLAGRQRRIGPAAATVDAAPRGPVRSVEADL